MVEHEYAMDVNGDPVYIENAATSTRSLYFCPECKAEMVVKNQGRKKEHHFAHYNGFAGEGESPAHSDTILFLLEQFRERVLNKKSFALNMFCNNRGNMDEVIYNILNYGLNFKPMSIYNVQNYRFNYDILKDVDQIEREYIIPGSMWRPDLALLREGRVIRVIEVYYTNEDSPEKTEYYKKHGIDVIKIDLKKKPDAFSLIKSNWKLGDIENTVIYCYTGCNVSIGKETLLENFRVRELAKSVIPMLKDLQDVKKEVHMDEMYTASVFIEYRTLNRDIQKEIIDLKTG